MIGHWTPSCFVFFWFPSLPSRPFFFSCFQRGDRLEFLLRNHGVVVDSEAGPSSAHTGQRTMEPCGKTHKRTGLCVAGLLLPLAPDLLTLPGFFQYTELYCCFTLRATQLNICIVIKSFFVLFCFYFFCPRRRVGSIQLPEILECFSSRRRLVSRTY